MAIDLDKLFDVSDSKSLNSLIEMIEKLDKSYDSLIDNNQARVNKFKNQNKEMAEALKEYAEASKTLDTTQRKQQEQASENAKGAEETIKKYRYLKKEIIDLEGNIKALKSTQNKMNANREALLKNTKKMVDLEAKLSAAETESAQKTAVLNEQMIQKRKEMKQAARETLGLVSAHEKERKRLIKLRNEYKDLAVLYGRNSKQALEKRKAAVELDKTLKQMDADVGQFQRNVGNYSSALEGATMASGKLADGLESTGEAGQVARSGIDKVRAGFKLLLANPIIALFTGLAAAVAAVIGLFSKTVEGSAILSNATGMLQGVMSALVGVARDVVEVFKGIFNDPIGSLKSFGEAIIENIINRFKAAVKFGNILGGAIEKLFKGDFKGLKESANEAGQAIVQMATGLDNKQQKKFAEGVSNLTKRIKENAQAFNELSSRQREVRTLNRELQLSSAKARVEEEKANAIRDDATLSFKARQEAAEQSRQALEERAKAEYQIAKNNLDLLTTEIKLRQKNGENVQDLLDQQLEAQTALIEAQKDYTLTLKNNVRERNMLRQDELERDLDILIDGFDNQKTVNERRMRDERKMLSEREAILEETRRLSDRSFEQQVATIQKTTKEQINANELIMESDAVALNSKIRSLGLSEIMEGRLLEVIRDRRSAIQDLSDAEKDLNNEAVGYAMEREEIEKRLLEREANRLKIIRDNGNVRLSIIEEVAQAEIAIAEKQAQNDLARAEQEIKDAQTLAARKEEIERELQDKITEINEESPMARAELIEQNVNAITNVIAGAFDFLNTLEELRNQKDEERKAKLEAARERQLEATRSNREAQAAIEDRYDKKIEQIEKRQAERKKRQATAEKAGAVAQSIIDTALAVNRTIAQGGAFAIPLAVSVGIFGALRTAKIAATPIPEYWKGTDSAKGGVSWVGERGSEIVETPDGSQYLTPSKATLVDLPKGSKVMDAVTTSRILNDQENRAHEAKASESGQTIINKIEGLEELKKAFQQGVKTETFKFRHGELIKNVRRGNTNFEDWDKIND